MPVAILVHGAGLLLWVLFKGSEVMKDRVKGQGLKNKIKTVENTHQTKEFL